MYQTHWTIANLNMKWYKYFELLHIPKSANFLDFFTEKKTSKQRSAKTPLSREKQSYKTAQATTLSHQQSSVFNSGRPEKQRTTRKKPVPKRCAAAELRSILPPVFFFFGFFGFEDIGIDQRKVLSKVV